MRAISQVILEFFFFFFNLILFLNFIAYQAPPSMGFSRQECWNAGMDCHFLLQGILLDPGIKPGSLALQADALPSEPPGKPMDVEPTDNLLYMLSEATHLVGQTGLYI